MQKIVDIEKLDPACFQSFSETPDRAFRVALAGGFSWACFWGTRHPEEGASIAVIVRGKEGEWTYPELVPELQGFHLVFEPETLPRKDAPLANIRDWLQDEIFY